MPIISRIII